MQNQNKIIEMINKHETDVYYKQFIPCKKILIQPKKSIETHISNEWLKTKEKSNNSMRIQIQLIIKHIVVPWLICGRV